VRAKRAVSGRWIAVALAFLLATAGYPGPARAQPATRPPRDEPAAARPRPRLLPVAAALVPGLIVHGAGHFAAGDRQVARRLFAVEGIGLGLFAAGAVPLLVTGASRYYSGPTVAFLVSGVGLFGLSWLADVYGAAAGDSRAGAPPSISPGTGVPLEVTAGYGYVYDPRFDYRQFAVVSATAWLGRLRLAPSAWIALDDDNQRLRQEATWRLAGPGSRRPTGDGSSVEVTAALTHHRYPGERFDVTTGETSLGGRLDMARVGDSLAGSFAEMSLGVGLEGINYHEAGAGADLGELLFVRFGYGMVVGRPGGLHGEVSLYYDHRRDTFAGGVSPGNGPGSGFAGLFGAGLIVHLGKRWGVRALVEQGAARVAHIGLTARVGESP
jgi:hypothetical protein